jgi:cation:H+ antiporter
MPPAVTAIVLIVLGLGVLLVSGELLIKGSSAFAARLGISPLVIGLTVVAFGTSAPELAVSLQASFAGTVDVAVGNAVGSNVANVLLILGLSALVAPLAVSSQLVRWDVPLMIAASALFLGLTRNGDLSRGEGGLLFGLLLAYIAWTVRQSRREPREIQAEFAEEFAAEASPLKGRVGWQLGAMALGIGGLTLGAHWLVAGAVDLAELFGVSDLVIGLTIVSVGTSLPEMVTSVMASMRGERDIAVGNIVGSNLFNIMAVLGLSAVLSPAALPVSAQAIAFDIPVMTAVAIACLPIFLTGYTIARWEGALFLGYYVAYVALLLTRAAGSDHYDSLRQIMGWYVAPLTLLTLAASMASHLRHYKARTD